MTDALSHELASIRGRVEIKDFRAESKRKESNYDDVYQTVQIQSNTNISDIGLEDYIEFDYSWFSR